MSGSRRLLVEDGSSSSSSRRNEAKELFWRGAVAGQAARGVSIRDYCREHGLSESNFYAWRRELALRDTEEAPRKASRRASALGKSTKRAKHPVFAPVRVIEAASHRPAKPLAPPSAAMEIVFPDNVRLQLHAPVDAESLASVVRVLREIPSC